MGCCGIGLSYWRLTVIKILEYKLEYNNRLYRGFQTSLLAERPFFMKKIQKCSAAHN